MFEQLGLIGCGLMGGSFALALKRAKLVKRVVGYSKSPSTTERARQLGVIDVAAPSALLAVSGADIVLLAVPVAASEATFKAIRHGISSETLVMDVGSTKGDVIEAARNGLQRQFASFVPAHPIAGKELSGIEHAEASLFTGRQVVLTPVKTTLRSNVQRATQVWSGIGANVVTMTHEEHDGAFAAVSHLPHLLAFAYINGLAAQPQGERFLSLAGPGFRDFSRIAASDPVMWRDVLLANREHVLEQSRAFRKALDDFEAMMSASDLQGLELSIAAASKTRAAWKPAADTASQQQDN
ncbi:prephenate dehydrogenase/arogenate dehydrogenase family protein [Variovorax sp. NFACC27]|uniref:Prephenate dehydrogenase/arogenate dehydrogenase family protein n=1 Tax=Variovorax gossypii TaxID=1679495 RepID=A0A431TP55_9BURK|nr:MULTISPECIES: prephenate dehydrogenase/arogenate dehydrogenase family protein [Variovorax]SEF25352.1 prephenate dehydrogenase [Variovorax sp. NFACC28]SEG36093.1 prephenate dehydrogenase [Variovorax sp. NFACC29]SFD93898.1 prephenate dehydrogenase [Variovorax sp. NFACC26]SFH05287.1 prephenate dehydrogenase [Variovorax sp. NFACC27]RTQ35491.1 prephenate dehydrogenase/arogenate dehydrogenase family protein [Variovorax gossypii]